MDLESQRNVLLDAVQQQYKDNAAVLEDNRRLADEKISYSNEARGTYYSGQPTWERMQNAVNYGDKMNDLNSNLLKTQDALWSNIEKYLDKINAYKSATNRNTNTPTQRGYSTDLGDYYSSEHGYQFVDKDGNPVTANTWSGIVNYNIWDVVDAMAKNGDRNAQIAKGAKGKDKITDEERRAMNILGINTSGYGSK